MKNKIEVIIDESKLDTLERRTKIKTIETEMNYVLNSEVFKRNFINVLNGNSFDLGERSVWKKSTPELIYKRFMSGATVLSPELDAVINIEVDDYYTWKGVIGYTKRSIPTIYMNTKFFDKRSTMLCGSTLCHEYGHKCGFGHDFRRTKTRPLSICYLINKIYNISYMELFGIEKRKYKTICKRSWKTLFFKRCYKVLA